MVEWENIPPDISKYQGFIYIIYDYNVGKYYIGKKFYWSSKTKKPLKGNKNKRHYRVESDWRTYWGSSPKLLESYKKHKGKNFKKIIQRNFKTKFECAYEEAKWQMNTDCLFDQNSYNECINLRLRKWK